jgi:hypothetical protein
MMFALPRFIARRMSMVEILDSLSLGNESFESVLVLTGDHPRLTLSDLWVEGSWNPNPRSIYARR